MDIHTKYFIALLSAFINQHVPRQELDVDWAEIHRLATIHSVGGIVYLMAKKLDETHRPNSELLQKMEKNFASTIAISTVQNNEIEILKNTLNRAKVPHVFFKGSVIKNYYPVKEMRTMGDIDFLIKPMDREKTHKLLLELGYKAYQIEGEVWNYTKGTVHLEVHTQIMYHNISNSIDYVSYFSDVWSHVRQTSKGYTYGLTDEFHFLYLLVHTAKHFDGSGCGIRMLMDIAIYLIYFQGRLNWNYIQSEIQKLKLGVFSKNIFILCKLWFDVMFQEELPRQEESFYEELSQYILAAGTFGFYQRNPEARALLKIYSNHKVENQDFVPDVVTPLNFYKKRFFPDYKTMGECSYYSFIKNKPWLLPVGWMYRFLRCLINYERYFEVLINVVKSKEESLKQYEVLRRLGL